MDKADNKAATEIMKFYLSFMEIIQGECQRFGNIRFNSHAFRILCFITTQPDKQATMAELNSMLQMTKQQLSKLVNDLEDDKMVTRIRSKQDRRVVHIICTEEGTRYMDQISQSFLDTTTYLLEHATPTELNTLTNGFALLGGIAERGNKS